MSVEGALPAVNLLIVAIILLASQLSDLERPAWAKSDSNLTRLLQSARQEHLKGDEDASLAFYERATRLAMHEYGPNSSLVAAIYYEMGVIALQSAKFQKAEDFLSESVRLNPQAVAPRVKLAELLRLRGRAEESLRQANAALSKHHDSIEARQALALSFMQLKDPIMSTKAFAQLDAVAHGRPAKLLATPKPTAISPPAQVATLPIPVVVPIPKAVAPPVKSKAQPIIKPPLPAKKPASLPVGTPKAIPQPQPLPPPLPKPKPVARAAVPAPPPPEYRPRPSKGGLVPPPPPVVPVYPSFTPPPPPSSGFQLKTEAKVKPKEKPREAPKEEHPAHASSSGDDTDFLLDWAADKGGKKKSN